jgi:hypothetical protein
MSDAGASTAERTAAWADPEGAPFAFAGDWHGNTAWAVETITTLAAREVRVVVHCGDFGVWPGERGTAYLRGVNAVLAEHDMVLGFVDGNHEDHVQLAALERKDGVGWLAERVAHLGRGARWDWAGVRFGALGGAVSVDKRMRAEGRNWWPGETATETDVRRLVDGGPVDVLVCHDRPAGAPLPFLAWVSKMWPEDVQVEAAAHRDLLQTAVDGTRPHVIVHGHYHNHRDHSHDRVVVQMGDRRVGVILCDRDGTSLARNTWIVTTAELSAMLGHRQAS